jgi:hypothetical protein
LERKKKEIDDNQKVLEEKERKLKEEKEAAKLAAEEEAKKKKAEADSARNRAAEAAGTQFYSLEELKAGVEGIDHAYREQYLSPAEFKTHFGMTKEEFKELKSWKKVSYKKKVGLF